MRYEWDERKNHENQRKHAGISFSLATLAFDDPNCIIELDLVDEDGEQRWQALGSVQGGSRWRRDYPHHQRATG
jgi:uncharacterized DUF497 family protein